MKKVILTLLAVFCLTTMVFAINNADPDPDLAEKLAQKALLKSIPSQQVKGSGIPLAAGDYYIPKGSHSLGFDSLHIAVDSINANGVTGTVNLILDVDTLREPSFTFNAFLSVTNNVVVKPAAGRDVVLIVAGGASHGNGVQMIGFDKGFVTFDGSNNGTNSRNLIVTTEQTSVEVPFGLNTADADTVILKNLIIKNLDNGVTNFKYGAVTNDVAGIQGFTVQNCQIGSAEFPVWRDGVAVWGSNSGPTQGIVLDNEIYAGCRGITTYVVNDCNFSGNVINMMPTTSSTTYNYVHGIYLTGASGPTTIHNNVINCLEAATVSGTYVVGLAFAGNSEGAGEIISVVNNMINIGAADEAFNAYGIGLRSANPMGNIDAYHNTIVVNEHSSTLTSYAVGNHTNGTGSVDMELKNNIIINKHTGNTASAAIGLVPTTSVLVSDYNLLASAQNFVNYQGTSYADLTAWQASGQDAKSVSKDVTFMGATDLHLAATSDTDLDLVMPKIVGIQTDIDGDPRSESFYAYAGADEGTVYPATNDLYIGFNDDSDLANWVKDAWESISINTERNSLQFADAGWDAGLKRAVNATPGSIYKLTLFVETSGWDAGYMDVSVEGLGNDLIKKSIISEGVQTEISLIGIAQGESGNIYLSGSYPATHPDTVWVDSLSWDDQYLNVNPSADVAAARQLILGDTLAVQGVVTTTTNFGSSGPVYIQDATAGIAVYNYTAAQNLALGDEILVIGKLKNYNGLLEVDPLLDYIVLSQNNVVEPVVITAADMDGEAYEGMLVTILACDTLETGLDWASTAGSNKGFNLKDSNDSTFYCYIDKDTDIDGSPKPPMWPIDITGIVGDYKGAQLLPRSLADFSPCNQVPAAFEIVSPADSTVISSFDHADIKKIEVGTDSLYALVIKWTKSVDPDGDDISYEVVVLPTGSYEEIVTADTMTYMVLENETPWVMNGTYDVFVVAADTMGGKTHSDTIAITFDFEAPPEIVYADVVLVDGAPKLYAMFNMPIGAAAAGNFTILDQTAAGASAPAAVDSIAPNAVRITGNLPEDHHIALVYSGITAPDGTISVTDTVNAGKVLIPFSENHPEDAAKIITSFEANVGSFLDPNFSGSTVGTNADATTFAVSDEQAYRGSKSGKMTIVDDPAIEGGWYVRELHGYPWTYNVSTTSTLMIMVKGTDAEVEMRLSIKDTGYEQGPWTRISVTEDDWQVVSFDLQNDDAEGWVNGNGIVEGETVLIEGIHIRCKEDKDVVLYFDEFTQRPNSNSAPSAVTLLQPSEGYEVTEADVVQDSLIEVKWTKAVDPDGDKVSYEFFVLDAAEDTVIFNFSTGDTAKLIDAPTYEDNGSYKAFVLAKDAWGFFSSSDTISFTVNMPEVGIGDEVGLPKVFALHQNYPNPFNPITTIKYDLPKDAHVRIMIYDLMGRQVRTLVNARQQAGYQTIQWDARDNYGKQVSSGYYIYVMQADKFHKSQKMILLK